MINSPGLESCYSCLHSVRLIMSSNELGMDFISGCLQRISVQLLTDFIKERRAKKEKSCFSGGSAEV